MDKDTREMLEGFIGFGSLIFTLFMMTVMF